jgi:PEP-CTERM/exosortase A-associated glycosyltransferase
MPAIKQHAVGQAGTMSGTRYRVLHVLDHSWPVLSGYSVRSRSLVNAQRQLGYSPHVITGPLHQLDDPKASDAMLEGVCYTRSRVHGYLTSTMVARRWPILREATVVLALRERILKLLDGLSFDVIHAHSPTLCGLAGWLAATARDLPFVYEIRGFWEDAAVDQKRDHRGSLRYRISRNLESHLAQRADAVVGIAQHILADLQTREVSPEKSFHISNGVDAQRFRPVPRDDSLALALGLGSEPILGFIGSLYRYEGISWLVHAVAELERRGICCKLLILGEGEDLPEIIQAIRAEGAGSYVRVLGCVPYEQVQRYYSLIDILVYPRRSVRLTELVTPLKPLEAMAQEKAVLASRVGGILELVEHEQTGLLFRSEDIDDFCHQAERVIQNESLRHKLGERARRAVLSQKDWPVVARGYERVYEFAARQHRRKVSGSVGDS